MNNRLLKILCICFLSFTALVSFADNSPKTDVEYTQLLVGEWVSLNELQDGEITIIKYTSDQKWQTFIKMNEIVMGEIKGDWIINNNELFSIIKDVKVKYPYLNSEISDKNGYKFFSYTIDLEGIENSVNEQIFAKIRLLSENRLELDINGELETFIKIK